MYTTTLKIKLNMCVCVSYSSSGGKRKTYIGLDLGGDPLYLELQTVFEEFKPIERVVRT